MASSRTSLKRTLLLSTFTALSLFSATGLAQDNSSGGSAATTAQTSQAAATTQRSSETPTRTTQNQVSITNTGNVETTAETFSAPRITGGTTAASGDELTGFPSLTNQPLTTTYPPPTVPPTNNAPFMHRSTAPQGTVFIAVGAILGAFGLGILVWRGIIACLLHRSVARAANAQHIANDKASFPAPPAQFYKYTDQESTPSLGANGRGVRRTQRGPIPSATPSQSNLFFSPTAAGGGGGGNNRDSVRDSRFLPSGFYAAGTSSPSHAHGHSISLTNLRPDSRGQYGGMQSRNTMRESTPPESPSFGARRDLSTSSVNLSSAPANGQRAPSAYLEDLLDENPNAFPPAHPGSRNANNNSPGGRF
ncbi:csi2 protein-like protein [Colletotrichum karsti]|uniref:Csi2 protein-like protein n=1 Tax=Colletotrichum karsti TaxID=1095194 RepID=A0A9P6IEQ9_9PEZI|nr:csi2 protein-like protein [Colletotrichum karsti]KAF9881047.1 csi2 protein-like protein [Colletotrichum karsti]